MSKRIRVQEDVSPNRIVDLELSQLSPNPKQPRKYFDEQALRELAKSIKVHGLIQPISVIPKRKKGEYYVVAGERRLKAFQQLKRKTIPAIVTSGKADELALVENIQRQDLNPLEEAEALRKLQARYDYTQKELAQVMGKARSTITNLLAVTSLPNKIKRECSSSNLSTRSFLIELAKVKDKAQQLELWEDAKRQPVHVSVVRAKKKGEVLKPSQLRSGEHFVRWLESLAQGEEPVDTETYDAMLALYERFLSALDEVAHKVA